MSDTPQGPGWWLASDGKYYAPEQASGPQPEPPPQPATPPPVPPPIAQPPAPQPPGPQPANKSGGKGCIYALIAVAAVVVLGVIGIIAAVALLGGKAADKIQEATQQNPCPFLSDSQASDALGQDVQAVKMSGFYEFLRITVDTRVLPAAPDCVVITTSNSGVARVAKYDGSDASSAFDQAKNVADGTSQDQGNGLSVETESYISDQAVTVGDEGFCTTTDIIGNAGVLVRKGGTLVYTSTDSGDCAQAQALAKKILG
jgi:hypothetical protein